ncbi:MAG: glycosyltransferase family 2 protein [Candidatus Melainabacteria bacterium]|nr:glycosyltransferase family 2 protein [Candidatus Melainabacteria bacterium]
MPEITVVIPAYNEELRLPATLSSVHAYMSAQKRSFEILVVDDGSSDATVAAVEDFAGSHENVRVVSYKPNRGKGYAVRTGMMAAEGDLIIFNDADGSSPIEEIEKLIVSIEKGSDIAIGSRAKPDESRFVDALAYRKYLGNSFNLIVRSLVLPGIYDTQCGFKMFKREVARDIFSVATMDGFAFDVEILYIARLRKYAIDEVPINWANVEGSKVNVFTDSPRMFLQVLKVAIGAWTGRYKR